MTLVERLKTLHGDEEIRRRSDDAYELITEAIELIEAQQAELASLRGMVPVWVSVKDRMPNPEEYPRVQIYTGDHDFMGVQFFDVNTHHLNECFFDDERTQPEECLHATHWQPLPHPPASEGEK